MLDNPRAPRVRAVARLQRRRARSETGLFLVEGPQAVAEAVAHRPDLLVDLYMTGVALDRWTTLAQDAADAGAHLSTVTEPVLAAMADTVAPQGVLAVARRAPAILDDAVRDGARLVVVLHEVRDPGNAGTVIRVADAAGADAVVLAGDSVDPFNPKVVRSTTGSIFHLPVVAGPSLEETLAAVRARGLLVVGADMAGEPLPALRADLARPVAWVFGNEAHGLPDTVRTGADRLASVPIYGAAESMNLATAASVCIYETAFAQRTAG